MVISVINNKGGTGKTTTSVNLADALCRSGYRVLLVDLDSQASASLSLGISYEDLSPSSADVLFNGIDIRDSIRNIMSWVEIKEDILELLKGKIENEKLVAIESFFNIKLTRKNFAEKLESFDFKKEDIELILNSSSCLSQKLDLLTGGIKLAHSDLLLADFPGRETVLAGVLEEIKTEYDFIICDCAPSLSMLPVNAFLASDKYIVPVTPEYLALEGLVSLMDGVGQMEKGMGIELSLMGIVFTNVNSSLFGFLNSEFRNHRYIINLVREQYGDRLFNTLIRKDLNLAKAPSYSKTIFEFAPGTPAAEDYRSLADEVLKRCGLPGKGGEQEEDL